MPAGFKDGAGPYSVVYLSHGAGGDENKWPTKGGAVKSLDSLIKRGLMRASVVIMPTAGPASWWANGASEKAETAIMDDLLPPETSVTRRAPQFVSNGQFDPDTWKALNYPAHLETYKAQPNRKPMWIVSGDHDFLNIAVMSANLYWRPYQIQPKQAELRVIDGDHEWRVFRDALPVALQYFNRACARGYNKGRYIRLLSGRCGGRLRPRVCRPSIPGRPAPAQPPPSGWPPAAFPWCRSSGSEKQTSPPHRAFR